MDEKKVGKDVRYYIHTHFGNFVASACHEPFRFCVYWTAQFPLELFDSPRPRLVRCVSCAPPTTTGAFFDVDADAEAEERGTAGDGSGSATVIDDGSSTPSGTVDAPE
jgi:hypothetical protein